MIDLNGDGMVNFADLTLMKGGFFAPPGPSAIRTAVALAEWLSRSALDPVLAVASP